MTVRNLAARAAVRLVRCAIYTRKSTEEGLDQEFNSLDAQRDAGEAYVRSQSGEGWVVLPDRYDDGGFTGGNTDRPGLRRLMADLEAGRIDCVVVYKVDRLSRSLLDFAQLMQRFEQKGVSFVSVTQQFNTASSMGRLVLNVLLSFAQFEREIVGERTRDKIAATRRKGKWGGGRPVLGYDREPGGRRLVINADEAERVRAIFQLYLRHGSLLPVVRELGRRGWVTKRWADATGRVTGGKPFTRTSLYQLLTNVLYAGRVRHKADVYPGEHPALVDPATFDRVQDRLRKNGAQGAGPGSPDRYGALLKGVLRCGPCGAAMTPTCTTKGTRTYRYYACVAGHKKGAGTCPSKPVPAGPVEGFVVDRVRAAGRDPELLRQVVAQARRQQGERLAELTAEETGLAADLVGLKRHLALESARFRPGDDNGEVVRRLAALHEKVRLADDRVKRLRDQQRAVKAAAVSEVDAATALAGFDPVWAALAPAERARVIALLVERVAYDGAAGKVAVTFRPTGLTALAAELAQRQQEQVA
ncbi:recombinase family protein [bacterium]|nr:recombinase family protein [bacterium]